jgi:hypothetical protein
MPQVLVILSAAAVLSGAALGILALLVAGIRRGDRSRLADDPGNRVDAIARRLLVGIRDHHDGTEGEQ